MTMRGDLRALVAFKTDALKQASDFNCRGFIFYTYEEEHKFWLDVHSACMRQMNQIQKVI